MGKLESGNRVRGDSDVEDEEILREEEIEGHENEYDDDEIDEEEALRKYRQMEATKPSVVGSLELAYARNIRGNDGSIGRETIRHDESIVTYIEGLKHVMLDRERIASLNDRLASALRTGQCTHLHLQYNRLIDLSFFLSSNPSQFSCKLKYLHLAHNNLTTLTGLSNCPMLLYLDVSYNKLEDVPPEALPRPLKFFNIVGNPCTADKDCLYEIICSLDLLEELDGMYITNEVREEAHTQLGIDFNEKDFESRIKVEEEKSFSNGHNYNANEADDPLENNRMNRRMSAAGEALKALTVEEEIDIYRSAATLAANEDVANKTMKDERSLADSSNIRNDEDLITSETGSDERNNDIISTAVADAELAVKETAKRIIHASRMRLEEYKQMESDMSMLSDDLDSGIS